MKNKLIYSLLLFTLLLVGASCKKYLDKKSDTSLVVPTSLSDLQALLDFATVMNLNGTPSFGEASSDDLFLVDADYNSFPTQDQNSYTWTPYDNAQFPNDWSYCYTAIYPTNYCLEQIDKVSKSNLNSWNNVKGSAFFYRSYYFSQLVWTFAKAYDLSTANTDLGIAIRLTSDFNEKSIRSSVQDSYNRIISDAKESISYLPDLPNHPFRPSKAAAYGLLARVYLSMRQYDSALVYSNKCLQIKSDLIDYNGDPDIIHPITDPYNPPFKQFNKETIFYTVESYSYAPANTYFLNIDTLLLNSYSTNDLRLDAFFTPNQNYPPYTQFKGSYTSEQTLFSGIATDEIYLIRAECYARTGNKASALNDLNTLLVKRYNSTFSPITAVNATDALSKILIERRKELLLRGLRFIDVKRLNKEGANITMKRIVNGQTYTISPNDKRYALPLPRDVINASGMPQNPY